MEKLDKKRKMIYNLFIYNFEKGDKNMNENLDTKIQIAYQECLDKIKKASTDQRLELYINNYKGRLNNAINKKNPDEALKSIEETNTMLTSEIDRYNEEIQEQERKTKKIKDRKALEQSKYSTDDVDPKNRNQVIPNVSPDNSKKQLNLRIEAMAKYLQDKNPEFVLENIYQIKDKKILESILTENKENQKLFIVEEYDEEMGQQLYNFYSLDQKNKLKNYRNTLFERKSNDLTLDRQPGLIMVNKPGFKVGAHGTDVSNVMTINNGSDCITIYRNEKGELGLATGEKSSSDISSCEIEKVYDKIEFEFKKEEEKNTFTNQLKGMINNEPVNRNSDNKESCSKDITR